MVYGMAWRAWHCTWYSLMDVAWYLVWPGGNNMVYFMDWRGDMVYGMA